ncbi:MAG: phage holin family protein [Acidobacteriaceae bacterium]|nr:phage holin family protein [Acidobacteriaceae bacterium]
MWAATQIVPGVTYDGGVWPFLGVAFVFGLVNATIGPLTKLLTCPLILLTLGLFALVVNGLMLSLTSRLSMSFGWGFHVDGFWPAFWGGLVVSIVSAALTTTIRSSASRRAF